MIPLDSPFHPDNEAGYQAWRTQKLAGYPQRGEDLIVPVEDPRRLSAEEYAAIWHLVQKTNMVIYATDLGEREDKESIKQLAAQFGLQHLAANWLADEDGISSLTPHEEDGQKRGEFIPYTHNRSRWHTDGYYNPPEPALQPEKYWRLVKQTMAAAKVNYDITTEWMRTNGTFKWVPPKGGFLSFPTYDLNVPSWDLCVRLLEKPYKTYILPGSCYGVEGHVRLGVGPGTPAESMKAGLEQIDQFVADYKAGKVKV